MQEQQRYRPVRPDRKARLLPRRSDGESGAGRTAHSGTRWQSLLRAGREHRKCGRSSAFSIIHQQAARLCLDLKAADIAIGVVICGIRRHPCGIEAVFRAVDGRERPFAAGLHQTITAAVCLIRKKDGLRKRQRLQLLFEQSRANTPCKPTGVTKVVGARRPCQIYWRRCKRSRQWRTVDFPDAGCRSVRGR